MNTAPLMTAVYMGVASQARQEEAAKTVSAQQGCVYSVHTGPHVYQCMTQEEYQTYAASQKNELQKEMSVVGVAIIFVVVVFVLVGFLIEKRYKDGSNIAKFPSIWSDRLRSRLNKFAE